MDKKTLTRNKNETKLKIIEVFLKKLLLIICNTDIL